MRLPLATAAWEVLRRLPSRLSYAIVHGAPGALARAVAAAEGRPPGVDAGPFKVKPLGVEVGNLLGVAAGFDKDARLVWIAWALGAGFHVVGSVLPRPHRGARVKLVARLPGGATLNRLGLPSEGVERVAARLSRRPRPPMPLAASVAALEPEGYPRVAAALAPHVNWLEVNISCPNTREHRTFEDPDSARKVCSAAARAAGGKPVLLKIPPPLGRDEAWAYADAARECSAAGVVASNTLRVRLDGLEAGLGGAPLYPLTRRAVAWLRERLPSGMAVVAVGGVTTPARAVGLLEAGADLVEAISALLTRGPRAFAEIAAATASWASRRL